MKCFWKTKSALMGILACVVVMMLGVVTMGQTITSPLPLSSGETDSEILDKVPNVIVSTQWSHDMVRAGGNAILAVVLDIATGYHINADGNSLAINVNEVLDGVEIGEMVWPKGRLTEFGEYEVSAFLGRTVVYVPVHIGENVRKGHIELSVVVNYQACDDHTCFMPEEVKKKAEIDVVGADVVVTANNDNDDLFSGMLERNGNNEIGMDFFGWGFQLGKGETLLILIVSALGGLLLNFTPCVLPLIPIKIMGLAQMADSRGQCFMLGGLMSVGVLAFWIGLGLAVSLVSGFTAANQLFQYPLFTMCVGVIIGVMGIGMLGVFTVRMPKWVYRINPRHDTVHGALGFGVMAAVLSTPCTAPFMGSTAAWAATQPPMITMGVFGAIGIGMGLPYLILSAFPGLVEKMPRGGEAGELIKQVMGMLMLAAAAYFMGTGVVGMVAEAPDPPSRIYWWVVAGFIGLTGIWLVWRTLKLANSLVKLVMFVSCGVVLIVASGWVGFKFTDHGPIDWVYYTPERFAEAEREDKVIVLEFTAEWCLNCKALEQSVLDRSDVVKLLSRPEIVAIKVDLTGNNEAGNRKMREIGSLTIPLLIVYDYDGSEVFRSDAYTVHQLVDVLERELDRETKE